MAESGLNSWPSFAVINKTTHPDILFPLDVTCLHTYSGCGCAEDDFQLVNADGMNTPIFLVEHIVHTTPFNIARKYPGESFAPGKT